MLYTKNKVAIMENEWIFMCYLQINAQSMLNQIF